MEHVIGEEKYECVILNVVISVSRMLVGLVWCGVFIEPFCCFCVCIFGITKLLLFQMFV